MGQAGQALKQALELHGISQNCLATALGVESPIVFRWFHEQIDPTAETVVQITKALQSLDPSAANSFVGFYLGNFTSNPNLTHPPALPQSDRVSVSTLARLFERTTNSYKYLFFLSILDILKRRKFDISLLISFAELAVETLANAWFPHVYFKLSFGIQDKITEKLDALNLVISEPILKFNDPDKKLLRKAIKEQIDSDLINSLLKYVPFRLIRPFFMQETRRLKDSEVNQSILELANNSSITITPLYHFDADLLQDCQGIIFSQAWAEYIEENFTFVQGWASWQWLQYMQLRNPTTPNVVNKLFIPQQRGSLSQQTKFWKSFLEYQPSKCIYSHQILSPDNFSLDHYLPWSFVAHDQLWNLIPVITSVNSSKSNKLPSNTYFPKFVDLHHLALVTNYEKLPQQTWNKTIESYINDLNISSDTLLEKEKLFNAYESIIKPLITLAEKQGFSSDWIYITKKTA